MGAPRGLGRPNCSGLPSPADPLLPGQTVAKLFGALFVALDALLFVSFLSSSFDIVFYLLSEPLGAILSSQTDPPTFKNGVFLDRILTLLNRFAFSI